MALSIVTPLHFSIFLVLVGNGFARRVCNILRFCCLLLPVWEIGLKNRMYRGLTNLECRFQLVLKGIVYIPCWDISNKIDLVESLDICYIQTIKYWIFDYVMLCYVMLLWMNVWRWYWIVESIVFILLTFWLRNKLHEFLLCIDEILEESETKFILNISALSGINGFWK